MRDQNKKKINIYSGSNSLYFADSSITSLKYENPPTMTNSKKESVSCERKASPQETQFVYLVRVSFASQTINKLNRS